MPWDKARLEVMRQLLDVNKLNLSLSVLVLGSSPCTLAVEHRIWPVVLDRCPLNASALGLVSEERSDLVGGLKLLITLMIAWNLVKSAVM